MIIMISGCTTSSKLMDNNNSSVYYEIFVGSFYDSNDDGIGDINGIREKLDYIASLGVKGIWLTPIHQSNSYHKYDVLDYMSIDVDFGSIEDFELLISEAKTRNIDIVMDLVLNHTSNSHPWFVEAKKALMNNDDTNEYIDYYNFSTSKQSNSSKLANNLYYEAVFSDGMPDLNLDSLEVRNKIKEIVAFWLDKGVSGFRLDAALHYYGDVSRNNEFLSWLNDTVKNIKSDSFIVAEVWSDTTTINGHYESGIDSFFNFPASFTDGKIVGNIRSETGASLSKWLAEYNNSIKKANPSSNDSPFLSNHDQARSSGFFKSHDEKWRLMINTYLLAPGTPFIYYGEELGMSGSGIDQNKRLAMPWDLDNTKGMANNPEGADYTVSDKTSVKIQDGNSNSLLNHYRNIMSLRNKYPVLYNGQVSAIDTGNPSIYALKHVDDSTSVIVIHNYSKNIQEFKINDEILNISTIDKGVKIENGVIEIQAYTSAILEIKR